MIRLSTIQHVYFLGIGGIGMSALARYFKAGGKSVYGYDKTPTDLTDELIAEGIAIHFNDEPQTLPECLSGRGVNPEALIIYTPAIPSGHRELQHLKNCGYRIYKRSEVLGMITRDAHTIAVAGTHGKTTTSTMIAHILKSAGIDCTAFLGGISKNYNTNLLLGTNGEGSEIVVVEADEFDRSFLTLHPDIAVITSLDADHLDIYNDHASMIASYNEFAGQVHEDGTILYRKGLQLNNLPSKNYTYGIENNAAYTARNVRVEEADYLFDITSPAGTVTGFRLTWPGRHNVENATGAFAACSVFGISTSQIRNAIESFSGVKRRFDFQVKSREIVFIDDYAHHPEELRATILSVKELFPGRKVLGIFQPHLYTRTRDFANEFAKSLSLLDELILMEIYPARELPIEGVTSSIIASGVTVPNNIISSREKLMQAVASSDAQVVLTLGAGDIDQLVAPIKKLLEEKYHKQTA